MNVEINEQELQEYADQRMKERIEKLVEARLKEIDWYKRVDQTVLTVVARRVTLERCNKILEEIDRNEIIGTISKYLAEMITDKLFDGYK